MNPTVGSIQYDARIDTSTLKRDAAQADAIAKGTGDNIGHELERGESRGSAALAKLASAAKVAAAATGAVLAAGLGAAAKASWDQVGAVQQATVGLNAYEKDAGKVNSVLKDLISYARSDLGVLFNRKDLFQSAQNLKLYGDNTEDLTKHVKILSRSVGLGLSTWEGLNNVIGRVGSTGRLYADDLQYLQNAGFQLDKSLSGSTQTFESLFALLDKGIPADALNGQANTIQGLSIRLQTAFRSVGDAILGVDSETSRFVQGGLGDRLTKGIASATVFLRAFSGSIREEIFPALSKMASIIAEHLGPSLAALGNTFTTSILPALERWLPYLTFGAQVLGGILLVAIWVVVNALNALGQVLGWVGQVVANVGQWFVDRWNNIRSIWSQAAGFFHGVGQSVANAFSAVTEAIVRPFREAYDRVRDIINKIKEAVNSVKDVAGGIASGAGRVGSWLNPFRAAGGPVTAGQPYIVGEQRPELFVPRTSGTIIPEVPTGGSSTSNVSISIDMKGIMARSRSDLRDIGKDIISSIDEELKAKQLPPIMPRSA